MYTWNMPDVFPQSKACFYSTDNAEDYFYWQTGKAVAHIPECVYFDSKATREFLQQHDYLPNNTASLLLSGRLIAFLQQTVPECVAAIPAVIRCKDGNLSGYYLLHIVKLIAAINEAASSKYSFGVYKSVVYLPEADQGLFIARCLDSTSEVLVSSELMQQLRASPYRHLQFYPCCMQAD